MKNQKHTKIPSALLKLNPNTNGKHDDFDEPDRVPYKGLTHYPNTLPPFAGWKVEHDTDGSPARRKLYDSSNVHKILKILSKRYTELSENLSSLELHEGRHQFMGFSKDRSCILTVGLYASYGGGYQKFLEDCETPEGSNTGRLRFSPSRLHLIEFKGGDHKRAATSESWRSHRGPSVMESIINFASSLPVKRKDSK